MKPSNNAVELRIFRGVAGLSQLAPAWRSLVEKMPGRRYHHLPEWYECFVGALEPNPEAIVFCAFYHGDQLLGIFPFREGSHTIKRVKLRCLELVRHDHMWLSDCIVPEDHQSQLTAARVFGTLGHCRQLRWDVAIARHTLADACLSRACAAAPWRWSSCRTETTNSFLRLTTQDEVLGRLSKSFRQNIRTSANKLKPETRAEFVSASHPAELDRFLVDFMEVEAAGWKGGDGQKTAIKFNPRLIQFYRELMTRYSRDGGCEIHLFRFEGKVIGGVLLALAGDSAYVLKVGYDEAYARLSPVHLLIRQILKTCEGKPAIRNLNLVSNAPWFNSWQPQQMRADNRYFFNSTVRGMAVFAANAAVERFRRGSRPAPAVETANSKA